MSRHNVPIGKVFGDAEVERVLTTGITGEAQRVEWIVLHQIAAAELVMNRPLDWFHLESRSIEVPVAGLFELREGKIELWRDYFEIVTFQRQAQAPRRRRDRGRAGPLTNPSRGDAASFASSMSGVLALAWHPNARGASGPGALPPRNATPSRSTSTIARFRSVTP